MILNLSVENYIIINKVNLDFSQGFSCFTGETGAGKSLVIDAIGILLGDKLSVDMIRKGSSKLRIEATIDISNNDKIKQQLIDYGFDNETLIISREVSSDNRSIARINGRSATVTMLKEIAAPLIDIHSQHDNQYLLNKKNHLELLDRYINSSLLVKVNDSFKVYKQLSDELNDLRLRKYSQSELEYLLFQVNEIEDLKLEVGEIESLELRLAQISNFEKTATRLNNAIELLEGHSFKDSLWQATKELDMLADAEITKINEMFKNSFYDLEDAYHQLKSYRDALDYSDDELNQIQSRLFEIKKIQRKFGSTYEAINDELNRMKKLIDEINNSAEQIELLSSLSNQAYEQYLVVANEYSVLRKEGAKALESAIERHLNDLDLPHAKLICQFEQKNSSADGIDQVEFLISMNKNVDPKPLSKAASGGELSRIMLGMKIIFSNLYGNQCVIFDEIDTGVSGTTAFSIGKKMLMMANNLQVISITHLAQVAACARDHFFVSKTIIEEQTSTSVTILSKEQRIQQLALLGFGMVNSDSLNAAQLLLDQGQSA
jgi:DNA repair protein RecN (Recombination protein N)